jgi:hypothetical protein
MLRFLGLGLVAFALPAAAYASAIVESLKGSAQVGTAVLRQGERISPQTVVTTAAGAQMRLRFDDGMAVLLEERTSIRLVDFRYTRGGPNSRVVLDLLGGAARVVTGAIGRDNPKQFFLRTPQASFGVLGESDFSIVLAERAYVSVSRGTVIAANRAATVSLPPASPVAIASAGAAPEMQVAVPPIVSALIARLGGVMATPAPGAPAVAKAPAAAPAAAAVVTQRPDRFLFVGASGGRSDIAEELARNLITSGSVDGEATGFKLFAGYHFHRNFAAEIAYVDLGEAKYEGQFAGMPVSGGKLAVTGINLAAIGRVPLGTRFALFAKVGLFLWEVEATDTTPAGAFSAKADGSGASFGIGASWDVGRNVALRAEAENFRVDEGNTTLLSLGVAFSF